MIILEGDQLSLEKGHSIEATLGRDLTTAEMVSISEYLIDDPVSTDNQHIIDMCISPDRFNVVSPEDCDRLNTKAGEIHDLLNSIEGNCPMIEDARRIVWELQKCINDDNLPGVDQS